MAVLLFILALLSILFTIWQWMAGRAFPVHRRLPAGENPACSILKPLKGRAETGELLLESWFTQPYSAPFEILFGVASADDPIIPTVRTLMDRHPAVPAKLVICQPVLGPNAKVSTLVHLLKEATFENIIISDDDVLAPPDLLAQLQASQGAASAALVSSFYSLSSQPTFGSRWEALATNADFWTQVLQGLSFQKMDFALGAVMATTRHQIQQIGGFESLLPYLADDYQLGRSLARSGGKIGLCALPVECRSGTLNFREAWSHQLRWARTIRTCRPVAYFLSILSNATVWPLACLFAAPSLLTLSVLVFALLLRSITAWDNYRRLVGQSCLFPLYFAPVKDLLQLFLWAGAFLGNQIVWRGDRFRVSAGGKLRPVTPHPAAQKTAAASPIPGAGSAGL